MLDYFDKEQVLNSANSLAIYGDKESILQFAKDMQALALLNFAKWSVEYGAKDYRPTWQDVAINAELRAAELDTVTIYTER